MDDQHNYPSGCFSTTNVKTGDLLGIGGTFPGARNLFLLADFEVFEHFFSKVKFHHNKISFGMVQCGEWLQACGSDMDPEIFLALHALQSILKAEYPEISKHANTRKNFYYVDTPAPLSNIVKASAAQCAEIALLAHGSLNQMGIRNNYISGAVAWKHDEEFPGEHCYIRIPLKDKIIVYDPSNPVISNQGQFPAIYGVSRNQAKIFEDYAARGTAFMSLKNILTHNDAFYGVHDGTGIDLGHFIVDDNGTLPRRSTIRGPAL